MTISEDIIMTDISDISPTSTELRSPRTPTWTPSLLSLSSSPFDYTKFLPSAEPSPSNPNASTTNDNTLSLPSQPDAPLPWIWQCHLCRHRYPLGVTRRCLYDGHYYCSGETDRPNLKKKRKGQACSSEFDYEGWADWGDWKRKIVSVVMSAKQQQQSNREDGGGVVPMEVKIAMATMTKMPRKCEVCDFPSECRTPEGQKPVRRKRKVEIVVVDVDKEDDVGMVPTLPALGDFGSIVSVGATGHDLMDVVAIGGKDDDAARVRVSTVQNLVKLVHEGRKGDKEKGGKGKVGKKNVLGTVEEEAVSGKKSVSDSTSLLMPVVDIWNNKSKS